MTIVCCDVHYGESRVSTACVAFNVWRDATASFERVYSSNTAAASYEAGSFYRRELPYLLAAVGQLPFAPNAILIDGYVWLAPNRPGLGAHLFAALERRTAVVGVAKRPFQGAHAIPVLRGQSRMPLYVTAAGIDASSAAAHIRSMHGTHRLPALIKRADRLTRDG